jgi:hypothetical protein
VALVVKTVLLAGGAVGEGYVVIGDVVEEVDLVLLEHQGCSNRVDGGIAPALVEETAIVVEGFEVVDVGLGPEPVEIANLEIGPEVAVVVGLAVIVADELEGVILGDVLGEGLGEVLGGVPEGGDSLDILVQTEGEAVLLLVLGHELEGVVVDVAVQLDAGFYAPVPFVVEHQGVTEEEAGLVAAHVPVADGVAVDDLLLLHFLANTGGLVLIDPLGEGPVLLGDLAVLGLARDEGRGDLLEFIVEVVVVQEDPVVVELAVEAVLDVANRLGDLPNVLVAGEGDEGSVHAVAGNSRRRQLVVGRGGRGLHSGGSVGLVRLRDNGSGLFSLVGAGFAGGKCVLVAGAVARPAGRRRHRRRRADKVEENEGLQRVNSCPDSVQRPSYKKRKDNVAEVALSARHCKG